ncbi:MAG: putative MFS-type transporter [Ktedonobacterales bacterium]|jgi:EmrB/QacA subfamily drug resistance transporter|nr:MAG: putative MFS-type transporter [Ktedonobacterales bacterium]
MRRFEYKWVALIVTTVGSLMVAIDSTIVILALPNMLQDLHSNLVRMTWVIMAYLLVNTVLQLTFGRMADMFGRVKMYNLGFLIFTACSVLCGLAPNDGLLILFRVLQGAGGAMLSANAMAIITEVFPPNERGRAMGYNAVTWGAGSVLGPVLGGLILAGASWRWIFLVNLPIGLIGTAAAYLLLHEVAPNPRRERFDLLGAALFTVGLVTFLMALTGGIGAGWLSPSILTLFAIALISLVAFVVRERRFSVPMLDLKLFDNRIYAYSVAAAALQSLAIFAVNFLLIFYLQGVRAFTPLTAALLILPMPLVSSFIGPLSGGWADRVGGAIPATLGLALQATALVMLTQLTPATPYPVLAIALVLMGLGSGFFWSPNTSTTMSAAPRKQLGVASATLNTMRNVGMVCSFAVALAVAAASMPKDIMNAVFLGTVGHLSPAISDAFTSGMSHAFLASIAICLLAIYFSVVRQGKRPQAEPVPGEASVAQPVGER